MILFKKREDSLTSAISGRASSSSRSSSKKPLLMGSLLVAAVGVVGIISVGEAAFIKFSNNHHHKPRVGNGASVRTPSQFHVSTSTNPTQSIYNQTNDHPYDDPSRSSSSYRLSTTSVTSSTSNGVSSTSSSTTSSSVLKVPYGLSSSDGQEKGELKTLLDEAVLLYMSWTRTSTAVVSAKSTQDLQGLIQDLSHAILNLTKDKETDKGTRSPRSRTVSSVELAKKVEESLDLFMRGEITKEEMEEVTQKYKSAIQSEEQHKLTQQEETASTATAAATTVEEKEDDKSSSTTDAHKVEEALDLFMQGKITQQEMEQIAKQYNKPKFQDQQLEEAQEPVEQEQKKQQEDSELVEPKQKKKQQEDIFSSATTTAIAALQQQEEEQQQREAECLSEDSAVSMIMLQSFRDRLQDLKQHPPPHTSSNAAKTATTTATSSTTTNSFGNRIKNGVKSLAKNFVVFAGDEEEGSNKKKFNGQKSNGREAAATNTNVPKKKVFPKLAFSNNEHPDPIHVQQLLDQATLLFASTFTTTAADDGIAIKYKREQAEDLIEEIGHVLYYAKRQPQQAQSDAYDDKDIVEAPSEPSKTTAVIDDSIQNNNNGVNSEEEGIGEGRSPTQIAQELEAALQLHMTMGDDLSKEVLNELAEEYQKTTTRTSTTESTTTTTTAITATPAQTTTPTAQQTSTIPLYDPGWVEVSADAIMESLQQRISALQNPNCPEDDSNRRRRSSIWEAVATGYTERMENGAFTVTPGVTTTDATSSTTKQRKRNGRKSNYDASNNIVDENPSFSQTTAAANNNDNSVASDTTASEPEDDEGDEQFLDDQYIDAVILEDNTDLLDDLWEQRNELAALDPPPTKEEATTSTLSSAQPQQQQQPKDNVVDANILPDKAITIPFNMQNMFWNKVNKNLQGEATAGGLKEEEETEDLETPPIDTGLGQEAAVEEEVSTTKKTSIVEVDVSEANQRALLVERLGLERTIQEAVRSSLLDVNQRALLEERLQQEAHALQMKRAEKLRQEEHARQIARAAKLETNQRALLVEQLLQDEHHRGILREQKLLQEEREQAKKVESNQRALLVEQILQEEHSRDILREQKLQQEELARAKKMELTHRSLLVEQLLQESHAQKILQEKALQDEELARAVQLRQEELARAKKVELTQRSLLAEQLLQASHAKKILQEKALQEKELAQTLQLESNQRALLTEHLQQEEHGREILRAIQKEQEELERAMQLESKQRAVLVEQLLQEGHRRDILQANKLKQEALERLKTMESNQRALLLQRLQQEDRTRAILRARKEELNHRALLVDRLQQQEILKRDTTTSSMDTKEDNIKDEVNFFMQESSFDSVVAADLLLPVDEENIDAQVQEALDAAESALEFANTGPPAPVAEEVEDNKKKERRRKAMQKMAGAVLDLTVKGAMGIASRLLDKDTNKAQEQPPQTQEGAAAAAVPPKEPKPPKSPPPLPFFARPTKSKVQWTVKEEEEELLSSTSSVGVNKVDADGVVQEAMRQPLEADDKNQGPAAKPSLLQVDSSSVVETGPVEKDMRVEEEELLKPELKLSVPVKESITSEVDFFPADTKEEHSYESKSDPYAGSATTPEADAAGSALDTMKTTKAPRRSVKAATETQSLGAKQKAELLARAILERRLAQPSSSAAEDAGKDLQTKPEALENQQLEAKQDAELSARALMERHFAQPESTPVVESSNDLPSATGPGNALDEEVIAAANEEKRRKAQTIARSLLAKPPAAAQDGVVGIRPDSFGLNNDFGDDSGGMQEDPLDKLLKQTKKMTPPPVVGSLFSTTTGWTGEDADEEEKANNVVSTPSSETDVEDEHDISASLETDQNDCEDINVGEDDATREGLIELAQETPEVSEVKEDKPASPQKIEQDPALRVGNAEGVAGLSADRATFSEDRKETTLRDIYGSQAQGSSGSGAAVPSTATPESYGLRRTLKEIYQNPGATKIQSDWIGTTNRPGNDVRTPLKEIYGRPKRENKEVGDATPDPISAKASMNTTVAADDGGSAINEIDNKKNEDDDDDELPPSDVGGGGGSSMNHPVNFFDTRNAWVKGGGEFFSAKAAETSTATRRLFRSTENQFKEGLRFFMEYMRRAGLHRILKQHALRKPVGGVEEGDSRLGTQVDDDRMRRQNHIATATALHFHPNSSALELPRQHRNRYLQRRRHKTPTKKEKELYLGVSVGVAALIYPMLLRMIGPSVVFVFSVFIPHCYLLLRNGNPNR